MMLPLWPTELLVDGVGCGLLNRSPRVRSLITRLTDLEARWPTALVKPSPRARLSERGEEPTATKAGGVAGQEAELRCVEQDLRDGAQARLVSFSMRLGLAKRAYEHDPATARKLRDLAQDQAEEALTELRHVVRGIHPPILTDRGLAGAVRALAASSGLDVTVDTGDLETGPRAPAGVEAAAYFTVAEAPDQRRETQRLGPGLGPTRPRSSRLDRNRPRRGPRRRRRDDRLGPARHAPPGRGTRRHGTADEPDRRTDGDRGGVAVWVVSGGKTSRCRGPGPEGCLPTRPKGTPPGHHTGSTPTPHRHRARPQATPGPLPTQPPRSSATLFPVPLPATRRRAGDTHDTPTPT